MHSNTSFLAFFILREVDMKYKYNDKFKIKNVNLDLEVLGCFPGGQQRTVQMKENSYKVLMNGCEVDITERNLDLLKQSEVKEETIKKGR